MGRQKTNEYIQAFGSVDNMKTFFKTIEQIRASGGGAEDVEQALRKKGYSEEQIRSLQYNDNGTVSVVIQGNTWNEEDLAREINKQITTANQKKQDAIKKHSNPKLTNSKLLYS